jgi:inosine-uridine nucleoside N-ribohydrolase
MAYVIDPSMFTTEKYKVDVECSGELTRGMTVVERRFYRIVKDEANVEVVVKVEADRFLKLINERISGE